VFAKVLVTGGAGFIGSHLVDRLVRTKHEVSVVDNLFTGKIGNLQSHIESGKINFLRGDVRDENFVQDSVRGVDAIIHLAAIASVPFSVEKPVLTNEVNVNGTVNLLRAAVKNDVKKFLLISSCAVYGDPKYLPVDEKHPLQPLSPYAASKVAAEYYCKAFTRTYGLKTVILRLFNVYGSRQRGENSYSGVITVFIKNLIRGKPLTVYGDGEQTRDFIHVKDVSEAALLALEHEKVNNEIFNVGSGRETSVNRLAELLIKIYGEKVKVVYEKPRRGDIKRSYADIRKIRKVLGFKPKTSLESGLEELFLEIKGEVT